MQQTASMTLERQETAQWQEFSDAHCHLNLFKDPAAVLDRARKKGVGLVITSGGSEKDSVEGARLASVEQAFAVIGVGPDFAARDAGFVDGLERMIKENMKIVGIGEIGLDAKVAEKEGTGLQKRLFEEQAAIAERLGVPIVIHCRGMLGDAMDILERVGTSKAMFHFFDGDEKQAVALAGMGFFISIPPALTSKRKRVIKEVSLSSLVVETDSPVVGEAPDDVIEVCTEIAGIKGVSLEEVAAKTTENIRRLFNI